MSVALWLPVRSASFAPIAWVKRIANASLETGPVQADLSGATATGCASVYVPSASRADETDSAASPAVEVTEALVDAVQAFATPAVNAPNEAGGPSVSESVAGTVPLTVGGCSGGATWTTNDALLVRPARSVAEHITEVGPIGNTDPDGFEHDRSSGSPNASTPCAS